MLNVPGPTRMLRPALPKVRAAEVKEQVANHFAIFAPWNRWCRLGTISRLVVPNSVGRLGPRRR